MISAFSSLLLRSPLQSLKDAYDFPENFQKLFEEGMYLSSNELWHEFVKKDQLSEKERQKLQLSLAKYWLRSCSRSTPYGTFAGSALVNIKDGETAVNLNQPDNHIRRVRLDMNYVTEIITSLIKIPAIRDKIKFFSNNSLYELTDSFRYAEYTIKNNLRSYQLTSVEKTSYVKSILDYARTGATIDSLTKILIESESVNTQEAFDFIMSLCDSQLLLSDLEPCVTGKEPLDQLIDRLKTIEGIDHLLQQFEKIQYLVNHPKDKVAYYQEIETELRNLNLPIEIPKNTLQTDLFLSLNENNLNKEIVQTITKQVEDLCVLSRPTTLNDLEEFKREFTLKYDLDEVALSIALDAELGVGYAGVNQQSTGENALIENLDVQTISSQSTMIFDHLRQFSLNKHNDYLKNGREIIEITEEELNSFKPLASNYKFSNSLHLQGCFFKNNGKFDVDNFVFDILSLGGSSAGNLLSRFTHGDKDLCNFTRDILKEEEKEFPDSIYAEIVHLPQARIGNVLLRPFLRNFELPYVGRSGFTAENQVYIDDLMVSVQNNKILLRSKKHNKYIIPKLTTAHNFTFKSLPVYKFLCELQFQGLAQPGVWDWGVLSSLDYLPRVVYKNLIIKKAQWKLEEKSLKDLPKDKNNWIDYFKEWRKKLKLPQRVAYSEADNKLLIDFEHLTGVDLLLHYLKRYKTITLEEFLFTEENCIVTDIDGAPFTNEVIIPLSRETAIVTNAVKKTDDDQFIKRTFSPYSEWLYFKIYCGPTVAEKILRNEILRFVETGYEQKRFDKFYFIRYWDDSSHIRIRFYNPDLSKQLLIQSEFMQIIGPFLDNKLIEKVVIDTYSRELERYGKDLIEEAESLFFNDSLAVMRFINLLDGANYEKYRMLFALRGIDILLNDFNFSIIEKRDLLKQSQSGYFKEFGAQASLQKQLNDKYRAEQQTIFSHMNNDLDVENEIEEAAAIFTRRSEMNAPIIKTILTRLANDKTRLNELLQSYIHMYLNRLFINNQRKYELVVYHFLERYYSSQSAINKKRL